MHILVLTPVFPNPSSPSEGLFNEQHARALNAAGVKVTILVCKPWLPCKLAKLWRRYHSLAYLPLKEEREGFPVLYARYLHIPRYQWANLTVASCASAILKGVQRFYSFEPFDLIQVHSTWPVGLAAPMITPALRCPFVLTMHIQDDPRLYSSQSGGKLYRRMLERASAVVGVGHPLESFIQEFMPDLPEKQFRIIPNGVDLKTIHGVLECTPRNRNDWGHLVSIGNPWPCKGLDLNLRALAKMSRDRIPWKSFTIVGEGPEQPRLKRLAQELGIADRVHFKGRMSHRDALQEIGKADIFSLPSWQEAFGVVYLEAMACGKPVIGCRGQGAEDTIRNNLDGLLVKPGDVEDLAEALRQLLENPDFARKLGDSGKSRAQEFTWERNAAQYLELYREVCSTINRGYL